MDIPFPQQCAATSKQSGQRCRRIVTPGSRVCHYHGGKSLKGPANPAFKDGRYSTVLPKQLRERYEQASSDETLLSLREQIALLDVRLMRVVELLPSGTTGQPWHVLEQQATQLSTAWDRQDPEAIAAAIDDLLDLIGEETAARAGWDEIQHLILTRERLVRSERTYRIEHGLTITVESAHLLLAMLVDAVREAVGPNDVILQRVTDAFIRLSGRPDLAAANEDD